MKTPEKPSRTTCWVPKEILSPLEIIRQSLENTNPCLFRHGVVLLSAYPVADLSQDAEAQGILVLLLPHI